MTVFSRQRCTYHPLIFDCNLLELAYCAIHPLNLRRQHEVGSFAEGREDRA